MIIFHTNKASLAQSAPSLRKTPQPQERFLDLLAATPGTGPRIVWSVGKRLEPREGLAARPRKTVAVLHRMAIAVQIRVQ